ncbi:hypothetical protein H0H92_016106 [Tricholoma furcatifolium]|nr:hypothetical protein H0H92_016106 [Tricholoma furcatifolium]
MPTWKPGIKSLLKRILSSNNSENNRVFAIRTETLTADSTGITSPNTHANEPNGETDACRTSHPNEVALEIAIPALDLMSSISGAIPIAGGPLKGVVNSLQSVIKMFDQDIRNKNDGRGLCLRLARLSAIIEQSEGSGDQALERLNSQLKATEKKLVDALNMPKIRFQKVADLNKECREDLQNYVQEYMLGKKVAQSQLIQVQQEQVLQEQRQRHILQAQLNQIIQALREHGQILKSISFSIQFVDIMGNTHSISMGMTRNFEVWHFAKEPTLYD